ncbi:MAG: DUF3990 domain-containing protein [Paludibacteraceae bacterium]|nr:DUF3990 domain-containing protein [Paludibacteraceae bacterium]
MKVYHASFLEIKNPDTIHSRNYLDFGKGFYVTTIYEQAEKYAQRFIRRGKQAWINVYEFDENWGNWSVRKFDTYNDEWLDFVASCRAGLEVENYDLVIGGIANDRVILTLDRYFEGTLSKDDALGLLRYEKPNIQYCIRNGEMIKNCLSFVESIKL